MEKAFVNEIVLVGRIQEPARYSHRVGNQSFWQVPFHVRRRSGTEDILRVLLRESQIKQLPLDTLGCLQIEGRIASYNLIQQQSRHLRISVLPREIRPEQKEEENLVRLRGRLCRPPIYRKTPLGREICDLLLGVPRKYGGADYLPCVAWGEGARMAAEMKVGDCLQGQGRLQSRTYQKQLPDAIEERIAYEVSLSHLEDSQ